jgi:hypothetical protein
MALRQRNVVGFVVNGDGVPVQNATVQFKLTNPLAYTYTHVVVDTEFTAQTAGAGDFSISLWCDEDSLVAVNYNVQFPKETGGLPDPGHSASFSLEYGAGDDVNISELINASIPAPTPESLLYTYIDTVVAAATAGALGFKLYAVYMSQTGTGDPTINSTIVNLLGGAVTWTRLSPGTYRGVRIGAFPANKLFAPFQMPVVTGTTQRRMSITRIDDDTIELVTNAVSTASDDQLANTPVWFMVAV